MNSMVPKLEDWSNSHSSAFKPTKTEATIFLPPNRAMPKNPPPIILRNYRIEYKPPAQPSQQPPYPSLLAHYRDALLDLLDRTGCFPRLLRLPEVEKKEKE
ncbi:hypothetical protein NBRC10513_006807 [Rhodotorula toruloides]